METTQSYDQLHSRIEELEAQLSESHEIIDAIRRGEVDAFVVKNDNTHELYTLRSADRSYRVFIEQMNEGALTINDSNIIVYANPKFGEIINNPLHIVVGSNLLHFLPASQQGIAKELIGAAWSQGKSKGEINVVGNAGDPLPLLFSLNKLANEDGETLSIIVTDLSLQKESMNQKMALEKKDEFISIASHELRTPVTSIKGYVQILRHNFQNNGNNEAADMLGKVDAQINKLTNLIGDLLDVKKIENGELQYHTEQFDFNALAVEVIEEMQRVIPHRIRFNFGPSKMIEADRNKIGQVITNLINNAAKFSPRSKDIIVSTSVDDHTVCLSVQDFGIGIPFDQQASIFQRFFRVNHEKENTYAGLGLGLYISSEILKRHQGKIYLKSEPDKGSIFYFQLPYTEKSTSK